MVSDNKPVFTDVIDFRLVGGDLVQQLLPMAADGKSDILLPAPQVPFTGAQFMAASNVLMAQLHSEPQTSPDVSFYNTVPQTILANDNATNPAGSINQRMFLLNQQFLSLQQQFSADAYRAHWQQTFSRYPQMVSNDARPYYMPVNVNNVVNMPSGTDMPPYFCHLPMPAEYYGVRRKNATRETTAPLKTWLNNHKNNPYPTKSEKLSLSFMTKMTLTQVSTWFANARRRLKKENKMTWIPRTKTTDSEETDQDGASDSVEGTSLCLDESKASEAVSTPPAATSTKRRISSRGEQQSRKRSRISLSSEEIQSEQTEGAEREVPYNLRSLKKTSRRKRRRSALVAEETSLLSEHPDLLSEDTPKKPKIWSIPTEINDEFQKAMIGRSNESPHRKCGHASECGTAPPQPSTSTFCGLPAHLPMSFENGQSMPPLNSYQFPHQPANMPPFDMHRYHLNSNAPAAHCLFNSSAGVMTHNPYPPIYIQQLQQQYMAMLLPMIRYYQQVMTHKNGMVSTANLQDTNAPTHDCYTQSPFDNSSLLFSNKECTKEQESSFRFAGMETVSVTPKQQHFIPESALNNLVSREDSSSLDKVDSDDQVLAHNDVANSDMTAESQEQSRHVYDVGCGTYNTVESDGQHSDESECDQVRFRIGMQSD